MFSELKLPVILQGRQWFRRWIDSRGAPGGRGWILSSIHYACQSVLEQERRPKRASVCVCEIVRRRLALYYCAVRLGGNTKWFVSLTSNVSSSFCIDPNSQRFFEQLRVSRLSVNIVGMEKKMPSFTAVDCLLHKKMFAQTCSAGD